MMVAEAVAPLPPPPEKEIVGAAVNPVPFAVMVSAETVLLVESIEAEAVTPAPPPPENVIVGAAV